MPYEFSVVPVYRATALALVIVAGCAPTTEEPIEVLGVVPNRVSVRQDTPAIVTGHNFHNATAVDLDDPSPPSIQRGWYFTIGNSAVTDQEAAREDDSTLAILVPRGLPLGQHDLTVTSPAGDSAHLVDALTVIQEDPSVGGGAGTGQGQAGSGASPATGGAAGTGEGNSGTGGAAGTGEGNSGAGGAAGTAEVGAGGASVAGQAGAPAAGQAGASAAGEAGAAGAAGAGPSGSQSGRGGAAGSAGDLGVIAFDPPTVVEAVADLSAFDDDPTFTDDRLELFFSTDRDAANMDDDNIWVSRRTTVAEPWGTPTRVEVINGPYRDATPGVSGDGLSIWFGTERPGDKGQYDIYWSQRPDRTSPWTEPIAVSEINTRTYDVAPQVTMGGLVMVVEENGPGGVGGHDLYLTSRPTLQAPWGTPQLIDGVNSPSNETAGRLVLGGRVLVFCSNRNWSTGEDIYYAVREDLDASFSEPEPLPGVNTDANDFDPWPSEDFRYLVFASNRDGSADLYETSR